MAIVNPVKRGLPVFKPTIAMTAKKCE